MTSGDVSDRAPVVELHKISKAFGATRALNEFDLAVHRGEVVGVVGDNGAGKSTLLKTVAGVHRPDSGELLIEGVEYDSLTPMGAQKLGIEIIHQNLGLIDTLDVAANLFINREKLRGSPVARFVRWLDKPGMARETAQALSRFELPASVVRRPARQLSGGQRQMVAVARAVHWNPRMIMMDEPTAALAVEQARRVLDLVRSLAASGIAVLFVSHDIANVLEVTERVVVLRHGRKVADVSTSDTSHTELVMYITGHAAP